MLFNLIQESWWQVYLILFKQYSCNLKGKTGLFSTFFGPDLRPQKWNFWQKKIFFKICFHIIVEYDYFSCLCRINIDNTIRYSKIYFNFFLFFRYEEHLINIWLVLIQNYPKAVVLGNDYLVIQSAKILLLPSICEIIFVIL